MKPGHPVILERDRYSPLYVIRCEAASCPLRQTARTTPNCQREGCWITSSFKLELAEAYITRHQLTEKARRL